MTMYVLAAWLLASVPLALLVAKTMRHGLTLADERPHAEAGPAATGRVPSPREATDAGRAA